MSLDYQSPSNRKIIAIIASSFLTTFIISRLFVYLVIGHWLPNFFLTIKGVHIHHFTYGVFILVLVGLYLILKRPFLESKKFKWATLFFGIGLGLTFDEFGMWVHLKDDYWVRQSYDAVIIIFLIFINMAYYRSLIKWLKELFKLIKNIFH